MNTELMFSSEDQTWETPQDFFDELDEEFHFTLDPCASNATAKCTAYFTEKEDGLAQSWENHTVFMNPPYSRQISKWIEKAYKESQKGATVVCLIPSRTDTKYWHEFIWNQTAHRPYSNVKIRFIKGRLKFGNAKNAAPFPSAVVIFLPKRVDKYS